MRMIFGVLGLLVVMASVGLLAKKQLGTLSAPPAAVPGAAAQPAPVKMQQQVQPYQQAVEGALQRARPVPDEK